MHDDGVDLASLSEARLTKVRSEKVVTHDSALARRAPRLATIEKGKVKITERAA